MSSNDSATGAGGASAPPPPPPLGKVTEDGIAEPSGKITLESLKAVEVYQNQVLIVDRLWAYFSQYSGLLVVLGFGLVAFRFSSAVTMLHWAFAVLPLLAYVAFGLGNHGAMKVTLHELQLVRTIAKAQTRLGFGGHTSGTILGFHLVMTVLVALAYGISAWYAMSARAPAVAPAPALAMPSASAPSTRP